MKKLSIREYLKPEVISKISGLELKAKLLVEGFISGLHKSPHHGFNVEFSEHRQYMPGDEIRYIDWHVYARTDKFFIKQFEEETNLRATIIVDSSKSMNFKSGSSGITKFEYGTFLAAALGYIIINQRDSLGLSIFSNKLHKFMQPLSRFSHFKEFIKTLEKTKPGGETGFRKSLNEIAGRVRERGLAVLISDFYDNFDDIIFGLRQLRYRKNEVILFHLIDTVEEEFDFKREIRFIDMETGETITSDGLSIYKEYKKRFEEFKNNLSLNCGQLKIDYFPINTKMEFDEALRRYLVKRSSRG